MQDHESGMRLREIDETWKLKGVCCCCGPIKPFVYMAKCCFARERRIFILTKASSCQLFCINSIFGQLCVIENVINVKLKK